MSATPVEQPGARAVRIEQWAQLNGANLEWLVDDDDVRAVFEDALWCAHDLLALLARLEAAERERDEALGVRAGFVSPVQKVLEERARAEAAEGEVARLRRTLEAMLDPSWWREDVDVNGEYTMSRALGYYALVPRIQEALAQSEGLPS